MPLKTCTNPFHGYTAQILRGVKKKLYYVRGVLLRTNFEKILKILKIKTNYYSQAKNKVVCRFLGISIERRQRNRALKVHF